MRTYNRMLDPAYERARVGLSAEDIRRDLPALGQRVTAKVSMAGNSVFSKNAEIEHGAVIYVNAARLWYTVLFDSGLRESYKLPEVGK